MRSHFSLPRGVTAACTVAGAAAVLNGNCAQQILVGADYATNATYAAGWSAGQNGGYGWGPWSMDNTGGPSGTNVLQHTMDRGSSPFNPFGTAWTLYNPRGTAPNPAYSSFTCDVPPTGTDISRAGRAFPNGGLQPGQTFSTIIANPTGRSFYRGYTIILSTGSDNIDYSKVGTQIAVGTFEYFSYGKWYTGNTFAYGGIPNLRDTNTVNGMELDVTMTGTNTYHLYMAPLNNPGLAYSEDGTVTNVVNWVTYQLYNTDSNFYNTDTNANISYPTNAPCGPNPTDFYIKSMTVAGLTLNIQIVGTNAVLSWTTNVPGFSLASSLSLGTGVVWSTNLPPPVVVSGQNVVTNPIANTRQFFRLQQ